MSDWHIVSHDSPNRKHDFKKTDIPPTKINKRDAKNQHPSRTTTQILKYPYKGTIWAVKIFNLEGFELHF